MLMWFSREGGFEQVEFHFVTRAFVDHTFAGLERTTCATGGEREGQDDRWRGEETKDRGVSVAHGTSVEIASDSGACCGGSRKDHEGKVDPSEFLEAEGCDKDDPSQRLESREEEEFAWDFANSVALLLELVKKVRQEEMSHLKGEVWWVTGYRPAQTRDWKANGWVQMGGQGLQRTSRREGQSLVQ